MKNNIIHIFIVSVFLPMLAFAQTTDDNTSNIDSCAVISQNLRYLSRDTNGSVDVSILQDFLSSKGYLKSQPTGFFGVATRKAVIAFQNDNGLRSTPPGFVGAGTRAKIKEIDCGDNTAINTTTNKTNFNGKQKFYNSEIKGGVTIKSPNGGETLNTRDKVLFEWESFGINSSSMFQLKGSTKIYLAKNNTPVCLLQKVQNSISVWSKFGIVCADEKGNNFNITSGKYTIVIYVYNEAGKFIGTDESDKEFNLTLNSDNIYYEPSNP